MLVTTVLPSNTPERISGASSSFRCVTIRLWPGRRRSRSTRRSSSDRAIPGGQPSMITTLPGPCDSPAVVTRKAWPKLFPDMRASSFARRERGCYYPAPLMTTTPLSRLSEDERLFYETVLGFANERVAPKVPAMDTASTLDASILSGLFELGLMGIEIPTEHGGAGSSFFNAILAVEALARVDPSVAVVVDVQNTL